MLEAPGERDRWRLLEMVGLGEGRRLLVEEAAAAGAGKGPGEEGAGGDLKGDGVIPVLVARQGLCNCTLLLVLGVTLGCL